MLSSFVVIYLPKFGSVALVVGLISVSTLGYAQEPSYAGRSLTEWVGDLSDTTSKEGEDKRRRAAYALGQMGPAAQGAVTALIAAVKDPNMEPRWYAVDALGRIGGDAAVARAVASAIEDVENDVYVRRSAAKSLGRLGKSAGGEIEILQGLLANDDAITRAAAALSLWQIARHEDALTALGEMLGSDEADHAFQACMALVQMGPDAASLADQLVDAVAHESADVRRAAAKALGRQGPPAAKLIQSALGQSQRQTDPICAAAALGFIADEVRTGVLYQGDTTSEQFDGLVAMLQSTLLPPLNNMLQSNSAEVRVAGSRGLAQLGPVSVPALLENLQSNHPDAQAAAVDALVRVERFLPDNSSTSAHVDRLQAELIPLLIDAMRHEQFQVRFSAVRMLAALDVGEDGRAAIPLLTEALEDEDAGMRRYAAKAIAGIQG